MKQELYCHNCSLYVCFDVPEHDGNLIVKCPNCGHEHYRVVTNGEITEERWGSNNNQTNGVTVVYATGTAVYSCSTFSISTTSTSAGSGFIRQAWLDTTTTG